MKKTSVLLSILLVFVFIFCSCGILNNTNKPIAEKLSENDIRIIKETMQIRQQLVSQSAASLFIRLDTLKIMKIAGSYSSSELQKQFDSCYDCCTDLLQKIEEMVDDYRKYPDIFVTIKSAIDSLIEIHDNIGIKTDQGNNNHTFTVDIMRELSDDIQSWDKMYSSAFSGLLSPHREHTLLT